MTGPRAVVVGGGVIGVSCAYFLARGGARVILLERGRLAGEASWGNAGTVSPGHPPLNRPGRVREGLGRMFEPESPLYIPPRWDPGLWRWLFDFAAHCTERHLAHAMDAMAPLGHRSLELFDALVADEAIECGYRREGYFDVCRTAEGLEAAWAESDLARARGYHPERLDASELRRAEPALGTGVVGGVHHPEAATLDPRAFVEGLWRAASDLGAVLREHAEVTGLDASGGRVLGVRLADGSAVGADIVVLATGPFSLGLAEEAGPRLPVQAGKGYHRDVPVGPRGAPLLRIACVLYESSVFCTRVGGCVRFAGTMELSGIDRTLRPERLAQIDRAARRAFPGLDSRPGGSVWCGLRPVSSDGLPIVGPVPGVGGLWVATGHGMLGLTLGPVTGELIADDALHGRRTGPALALAPSRFHRTVLRRG